MWLTLTASVFEFLFSNNSEFYAVSVNGGNCFVHTLSLFAKSKNVLQKQVVIESYNYFYTAPNIHDFRIDVLQNFYFFCKQ